MNRIEPARVPDVFKKLGLKPVTGAWVGEVSEGECCVLSALYCEAKGCTDAPACLMEITEAEMKSWPECTVDLIKGMLGDDGSDYPYGVMAGWDTSDDWNPNRGFNEAYLLGFADGRSARLAVVEAGLAIREVEDDEIDAEDADHDYGDDEE